MSLQNVFKENKPLLNIYCTAGYPKLNSLPTVITTLKKAGADMVEIGIPYSDPIADGPTIQGSNDIALKNGITIDLIFQQLKETKVSIPKIIMGYFNSIFVYGIDKFCKNCHDCGIEQVILPDLPIEIYIKNYKNIFAKYNVSLIFLVTPKTTEERIRLIDEHSSPFIYLVSSSSTTGKKTGVQSAREYLDRVRKMNLKNAVMLGFNISSHKDYLFANEYTNGAIIGSAFIRHIAQSENLEDSIIDFVHKIKGESI